MNIVSSERATRVCAWSAGACAIAMLAIYLGTGAGQEGLQTFQSPAVYAERLLQHPAGLRALLTLDELFVVLYLATFFSLGTTLLRRGAPRLVLGAALGALALLGLLDLAENLHFLVMLGRAEQGIPLSVDEIALQVWESLLKFHVGYVGIFLLGCALPRETAAARLLANLFWFVNVPVGVLIPVVPEALAGLLLLVRFAFFVVGFALVGWAFGPPAGLSPRSAAAGSGARA